MARSLDLRHLLVHDLRRLRLVSDGRGLRLHRVQLLRELQVRLYLGLDSVLGGVLELARVLELLAELLLDFVLLLLLELEHRDLLVQQHGDIDQ